MQGIVSETAHDVPSSSVRTAEPVTTSTSHLVSNPTSVMATSTSVKTEASTSKAGSSSAIPIASLKELKKRMSTGDLGGEEAASKAPDVPTEPWQEKLNFLVQILPDADPSFLEEKAREHCENEDQLRQFVADALENKNFPSRKDWLWRQEQLALQKKYTEEFSIPNFLEVIPDPFTYFTDEKRKCTSKNQANMFLRNK